MRLAVVLRNLPIPVHAGLHLIIHNVLQRLRHRHDLRAFVLEREWGGDVETFFVPIERYAPIAGRATRSLSRVARFYGTGPDKLAWLQQRIDAHAPDAIVGFGYDLGPYLGMLETRVPRALDVVDSEVLYMWRQIKAGARTRVNFKHLLAAIGAARLYMRSLDALITVSEEDSANVRRFTGNPSVTTIGNGVDGDFFCPDPAVEHVPGRVIFTGSLNWGPNQMAVEWFLDHCWARVKAQRPDASFTVVGKLMRDEQRAAWERNPDVRVIGFVPDIRPHVRAAQVSVAPMVSGSGIKNKILEAWAMGQTVVATPLAARGLFAGSENLLLAGSAADFADAVVHALNDEALRERLGAAGRATVSEHYSWDRVAAQFEQVIEAARAPR